MRSSKTQGLYFGLALLVLINPPMWILTLLIHFSGCYEITMSLALYTWVIGTSDPSRKPREFSDPSRNDMGSNTKYPKIFLEQMAI